jgi:hypothetical protein
MTKIPGMTTRRGLERQLSAACRVHGRCFAGGACSVMVRKCASAIVALLGWLGRHDPVQIMKQIRHKSVDDARIYVRDADLWRDNVTNRLLSAA